MIGDGGINNPWQANITLNAIADKSYSEYVVALSRKLFSLTPEVRKQKGKQALIVSLTSITLVDYLVESGLPRGNKIKAGLCIPDWILKKSTYRVACVRGLMDTDGCLYVHKHSVLGRSYENIGLCFSSHSPPLIKQVAEIFEEFGIIPHISKHGRSIYLYKASAVSKYLDTFDTSNERIASVYKNWKRG